MEPPHERPNIVNPDIMQHEYLEMVPPIATVDQHRDIPRHVEPLPQRVKHATPEQLRHHQELVRGDVPLLEDKVEMWKTHGIPKHPIWQFFTHAHSTKEKTRGSPHLTTTTRDHMDVVCAYCGAHIHQDHTLRKGETEAGEEITMARSVLHGMWRHLASQCPKCPQNVRHDMRSWHRLPKESLAAPAAPASPMATEKTARGRQQQQDLCGESSTVVELEGSHEAGGYEDDSESDDSTSNLLGPVKRTTPKLKDSRD